MVGTSFAHCPKPSRNCRLLTSLFASDGENKRVGGEEKEKIIGEEEGTEGRGFPFSGEALGVISGDSQGNGWRGRCRRTQAGRRRDLGGGHLTIPTAT